MKQPELSKLFFDPQTIKKYFKQFLVVIFLTGFSMIIEIFFAWDSEGVSKEQHTYNIHTYILIQESRKYHKNLAEPEFRFSKNHSYSPPLC